MGDTNASDAVNNSMDRDNERKDTYESRDYDDGAAASSNNNDDSLVGSAHMRPVFLGNLIPNYSADRVTQLFERPRDFRLEYDAIPVDRIDVKRGYCFVFLKDAKSQADKTRIEKFVTEITGMEVPDVSREVRAEFARGDGRVKRKEDERRKNIEPNETLFVVNFHEETTRKEDLEMLFQPYGEIVRIEMKRNFAFVQFKNIDQATKAKEATNGGKLDQSVLTVEYVAQRHRRGTDGPSRRDDGPRGRGGGGRYYDDRRPPPAAAPYYPDDYGRRGGSRYPPPAPPMMDDYNRRPPPPMRGRSRSRSPVRSYSRGHSRSPPPPSSRTGGGGGRYNDDRYYHNPPPPRNNPDAGGRRNYRSNRSHSPPARGRRSPSPDYDYRGGGGTDRDRGYRG